MSKSRNNKKKEYTSLWQTALINREAKVIYGQQLSQFVSIGADAKGNDIIVPLPLYIPREEKPVDATTQNLAIKKEKWSVRSLVAGTCSAIITLGLTLFTSFSPKQSVPSTVIVTQEDKKEAPALKPGVAIQSPGTPPYLPALMINVTHYYPALKNTWSAAQIQLAKGKDPIKVKKLILTSLERTLLSTQITDAQKPETYNEKGEATLVNLINAFQEDTFTSYYAVAPTDTTTLHFTNKPPRP